MNLSIASERNVGSFFSDLENKLKRSKNNYVLIVSSTKNVLVSSEVHSLSPFVLTLKIQKTSLKKSGVSITFFWKPQVSNVSSFT